MVSLTSGAEFVCREAGNKIGLRLPAGFIAPTAFPHIHKRFLMCLFVLLALNFYLIEKCPRECVRMRVHAYVHVDMRVRVRGRVLERPHARACGRACARAYMCSCACA